MVFARLLIRLSEAACSEIHLHPFPARPVRRSLAKQDFPFSIRDLKSHLANIRLGSEINPCANPLHFARRKQPHREIALCSARGGFPSKLERRFPGLCLDALVRFGRIGLHVPRPSRNDTASIERVNQ